jgi:putative ABC transport system ATP-binding protein
MTALIPEYQSSVSVMPELAVYCKGVTKTYGVGSAQVTALRGIDLEVKAGELMMLVGPSGCGKTTLISCVAGILDQDEGVCAVFGNDFKNMSQRDKTRVRGEIIGFVFQSFNLLPTLTAAENVAIPLLINRVPRNKALAKARELLGRVGLGDRYKSLPKQLSGGQQQRVAIARALVHDPKMIVCDEPTSALDHGVAARGGDGGWAIAGDRDARFAHLRIRRPDRANGRWPGGTRCQLGRGVEPLTEMHFEPPMKIRCTQIMQCK